MEFIKIVQNGYIIIFYQDNSLLKVNIKNGKQKVGIRFKPFQLRFNDYLKECFANLEEFKNKIKYKKIILIIEEALNIDKTYIKYLNFRLIDKERNESKEIFSKKIYVLNVEYYLTKGIVNEKINSNPFFTYIKKDYFNIEDLMDLFDKENLLNIYDIDSIKYFNKELGSFVNIKDGNIEIKEKLILELHIKERKNVLLYNLNQIKKYLYKEIITIKNRFNNLSDQLTKYDLIYLYASPIIKGETFEEFNAPISYLEEIRIILKLMNNNKKKLNCKFECANDKILNHILQQNKTKILHISSHGYYDGKYSLLLENLEKNGQILKLNMKKLKQILNSNRNNISQIDLVIVSTCYSQDLGEYFKECGAKNVIYISEKTEVYERICILFTKFFYEYLFKGNTFKQSYEKALKDIELNGRIQELNFNSCCCKHYHNENCLSNKFNLHKAHKKEKCSCQN